jgi:putative MATE family efflux protein
MIDESPDESPQGSIEQSPGPGAAAPRHVVAGVLREAIVGTRQPLTEGSVDRALFLLSVPMVMEMAMESLFAVVNVFWVARLGTTAVATVALTESLVTILFTVAMGLGMSTTAVVARRIGEANQRAAARTAVQAILLGALCSLVIGVAGHACTSSLLRLMGADRDVLAGASYARILFSGSATILLLFVISAVFRGAGDAATAMRALWLGNLINLLLDPLLIFGAGPVPAMGLSGAAIATTIARGAAVLYLLAALARGPRRIAITRHDLRFDPAIFGRLVRLSSAGILQLLIVDGSWIALIRIMSSFGNVALAGYTIIMRLVMFTLLPARGLCNAAATLVGQNLGAGNPQRAAASVWRAGRYGMTVLGFFTIVFLVFAEPLVRLFTSDPETIRMATTGLRYVSSGFCLYAWGMVITSAFNGAGDMLTPLLLSVGCFWLLRLPLAFVLARPLGLGPDGVFLAMPISFLVLAVLGILLFQRGRWRDRTV